MDLLGRKLLKFVCGFILVSCSALSYASTVNINVADAEVIAQALKGVGVSKAKSVVEYREQNGPFATVEDIALVKGIGAKTIELNRGIIVIE